MSLLRSSEMNYYKLVLPLEEGYSFVKAVAALDILMFQDENRTALIKPFTHQLRRVEELQDRVRMLEGELAQKGMMCRNPDSYQQFNEHYQNEIRPIRDPSQYLDLLQERINKIFNKIKRFSDNRALLIHKISRSYELKEVLYRGRQSIGYGNKLLQVQESTRTYLQYVAGVVETKHLHRFQKLVYRVTMGNSLFSNFEMPEHDDYREKKKVFLILYQGGAQDTVKSKINKICQSFEAVTFNIPSSLAQFSKKIQEVDYTLNDSKHLLAATNQQLKNTLLQCIVPVDQRLGFSELSYVKHVLYCQTLIYSQLNKLQAKKNILSGSFWCPSEQETVLFNILGQLQRNKPSTASAKFYKVQPQGSPPTYFELNQFTSIFQEIVNTYGTPRYGEVNPGLFAVAFFPFLFGIMFGDIGHGGLLLLFAIYLCRNSDQIKKPSNELKVLAPMRYILLLMGIFAFFSGFIYNDFLSLPLNLFGSCYTDDHHTGTAHKAEDCVYPLGFDPKWYRAQNQLSFFNSFKMKLAVILGVTQMSIAIFLKMLNTIHFRSYIELFFEWLPQQIFMTSTFGYMCLMIFKKWTIPWGLDPQYDTSRAPSIINQMIDLALKVGSTSGKPLWTEQGQEAVQLLLLKIAVIMLPLMLFVKPFYLYFKNRCIVQPEHQHDLAQQLRQSFITDDEVKTIRKKPVSHGHGHGHGEHFQFGQVFVHQTIQTIQFVLVSNTASYLRLWALSLAHSQLAKVFFEKTIGGGVISGNPILIVIGYFIFANITFGVIMCMDMMECFLHALRLQWVQFQSKFFKADGWKFQPTSFRANVIAETSKS